MNLENKAVLITGGSRGLGRALGAELARRGARVVLVARGQAELDEAVEAIRAQGGEAHGLVADVGDPEAARTIAGSASALVGPIQVLVQNASTLGPVPLRPLMDLTDREFRQVLETNLVGPFRLDQAIAGGMALRGEGVVVHISSDAAVSAYPDWGPYGVSKAGLDHLSRTWHAELGDSGVRFLALDPGEMDTRMHADAIPEADPDELSDPADVARRIAVLIERADLAPGGVRDEVSRLAASASAVEASPGDGRTPQTPDMPGVGAREEVGS